MNNLVHDHVANAILSGNTPCFAQLALAKASAAIKMDEVPLRRVTHPRLQSKSGGAVQLCLQNTKLSPLGLLSKITRTTWIASEYPLRWRETIALHGVVLHLNSDSEGRLHLFLPDDEVISNDPFECALQNPAVSLATTDVLGHLYGGMPDEDTIAAKTLRERAPVVQASIAGNRLRESGPTSPMADKRDNVVRKADHDQP